MRRPSTATLAGLGLAAVAAVVYWLSNRYFDAGRGDFFYLADAFLQGRAWLDFRPGPLDVIPAGEGRYFVPFAPFPAIAFMPLVALIGPVTADQVESGINAVLAGAAVGLCWMLMGRLGVPRLRDRALLTILFGFSTVIWWVTTRGGVWHTGHIVAIILTFGCLISLWGRQRAWLIGLLAGAAFLTRAPLALAVPFYLLMLEPRPAREVGQVLGGAVGRALERLPAGRWLELSIGTLPLIAFFFLYNAVRFGSPLESGYALAALPGWLEERRDMGLFSLAHLPWNLWLFLVQPPQPIGEPPFFRPNPLGMSVLITSPGLLLAALAPWRSPRALLLLGAAVAVLIPSLLYYGGGWFQFGYRYFLDSVPFVIALAGLAVARRGSIGPWWIALIAFGVVVNATSVYWAYNL
jgi:hypothetical protein